MQFRLKIKKNVAKKKHKNHWVKWCDRRAGGASRVETVWNAGADTRPLRASDWRRATTSWHRHRHRGQDRPRDRPPRSGRRPGGQHAARVDANRQTASQANHRSRLAVAWWNGMQSITIFLSRIAVRDAFLRCLLVPNSDKRIAQKAVSLFAVRAAPSKRRLEE